MMKSDGDEKNHIEKLSNQPLGLEKKGNSKNDLILLKISTTQ